jgi:hypothetical protein
MKVIDTPRTGKISNLVAYVSPFGQCFRSLCIPHDPKTQAQRHARDIFGLSSRDWGLKLSDLQRQRWVAAALKAPSHPSLGQFSHLSGQQFCVQINSTLRCVGKAPLHEPPAPVTFGPNPVDGLAIATDEGGGIRLLLSVGPASEDIMLFGQAPCSAGRMKQRRVCYLGLLGPATNGQCDITTAYTARFGQPRPGQKVFIVTCQQKNGWKDQDSVVSAIVPPRPLPGEQPSNQETKVEVAATTGAPEPQQAPAEGNSSLPRVVYKGSTPDARGRHIGSKRVHPVSILCTPLVHGFRMALARLGALQMPGVRA